MRTPRSKTDYSLILRFKWKKKKKSCSSNLSSLVAPNSGCEVVFKGILGGVECFTPCLEATRIKTAVSWVSKAIITLLCAYTFFFFFIFSSFHSFQLCHELLASLELLTWHSPKPSHFDYPLFGLRSLSQCCMPALQSHLLTLFDNPLLTSRYHLCELTLISRRSASTYYRSP